MGRGQLLDAARKGDERSVEKILAQITKRSGPFTSLRRGAGVNAQDDNGYTALHHACVRGHKKIVQLLLSVNASPCVVDKKGATPLHLAAWQGDSDVVGMLLAHDNPPVNIDQQTENQETALLIAAQFGYVSVVAQLIARGADVTIQNINQETALDLAAQYGRLETVQHLLRVRPLLVQQYKFPNSRGRFFSSTPLHRASKNGHKEVVAVLLAAGFDPNILALDGTPLHEAACFGKASVVRLLLANGADLNAIDGKGKTVEMILADYPPEATRNVMRVIREYESKRSNYESEEDLPPFPVQDSPTGYPNYPAMKAPETQKNYNKSESFLSPSSSLLTKNPSQSFVKKLASKCLGLKAKFNSAPNISNSSVLESNVDVSTKSSDNKSGTNTLLIGNSKFFKMLSKKEESGEIVCNDEFDTISLDRLGTLNRDSTVNRSNRSCPGFKTSLPNISENNELSDSGESVTESIVITDLDCDINKCDLSKPVEAFNPDSKFTIFEPRKDGNRTSVTSNISLDSANLVNECYESYEFMSHNFLPEMKDISERLKNVPRPPPRSNVTTLQKETNDSIYENVAVRNSSRHPTPAQRTHITTRTEKSNVEEKTATYENISIKREKRCPTPPKRSIQPSNLKSLDSSPSVSRSSTLSSDSMIDESNLEDILLSEKSRSFRHGKKSMVSTGISKSSIHRTESNDSDLTEVSAIENVDCSDDIEVDAKSMYLSMTGTLPSKKPESPIRKKVLFRHKTFTNIEVDKKYAKDSPLWNDSVSKDTLANYHIRGTGHCIYKAPTVQEFIYIFNRETLYSDVPPFSKIPNDKRDSYFETAICFCKPVPPKHHKSAEDLLNIHPQDAEEMVTIDMDALKDEIEIVSSSFRCFCDSGNCVLHANKRNAANNFVVKFSVIKRSISTPDITLDVSPSSTTPKMGLSKIKSVPSNLEEPYAVVDIVNKDFNVDNKPHDTATDTYVSMSPHSTLSSNMDVPYSIKDISEVISLNSSSSTDANQSCASDSQAALRKSSSSEHSGHWSLKSCYSNTTIISESSFKSCIEESSEDSDNTLHSDEDTSDAETVKSDVSTSKRPWVHSDSFRFGVKNSEAIEVIEESVEESDTPNSNTSAKCESSKFESGISVDSSESSSECEGDSGVPGSGADVSLGASLERGSGMVRGVRSGSGRRRWDEMEGTSEGDALSVSSAASSCAPLHLAHHLEYSKVSPTPPKKPPRRNLSVSPTHANSPSSGYSYELRAHARSQDDLDDIQGAKHYLKHGRSVDQYVDSKLSYSEYEENHNSPRVPPVPNPRPSLGLKNRSQPVAITAMYENVVIKEQNPRRKLRRNNFGPQHEFEARMSESRVRKYSHQEKSSLESLLDDQSMNSPSDCERYYDGPRVQIPLSPTHYEQPPTPDHPPPSAKQAENSIHERIRPLSQLIMEVVEEIRIRKKSQGDIVNS